jgi:UrcA family protein
MNLKLSLALAATLLPALALAETQISGARDSAPSVVVSLTDLDPSTPEGVRALHLRLSDAAWQVCWAMISKPVSIEGGKCREQLIEAAVADINRMRLASGDTRVLR